MSRCARLFRCSIHAAFEQLLGAITGLPTVTAPVRQSQTCLSRKSQPPPSPLNFRTPPRVTGAAAPTPPPWRLTATRWCSLG